MKAYLTISHGDTPLGKLRLTLRPDIVPKTVENFVHFLTAHQNGDKGGKGGEGYLNSTFHRIIPSFMAQGGDFLNHDGTGSTSIYQDTSNLSNRSNRSGGFPDENFLLCHTRRGTLSMANSGPNTNGCQFFITFRPTSHLDGKHVVFGYVDLEDEVFGEESGRVLDLLEGVRTYKGRERQHRPMSAVRIVDCGLVEEEKKIAAKGGSGVKSLGGEKLVGEEKKKKLLQAYGDSVENPAADEDEIDLDDDEEENDEPITIKNKSLSQSKIEDADEIDLDDEIDQDESKNPQPSSQTLNDADNKEDEPHEITAKPNSKKAQLQQRLARLRTKINQSRTLNRKEVLNEATRMGSEEAFVKEKRRQAKEDREGKKKEYDTFVVGKLNSKGEDITGADKGTKGSKAEQKKLASLSQPAYDSIRQMQARAEKKERSQFGPEDYYNPEGQYSNYERNLKSIRHSGGRKGNTATAESGGTDSIRAFDPTNLQHFSLSAQNQEREGAKRLANEMKRRAEKRANAKRKPEFDAYDVSYINDRNKRFNAKIGRNFDEHTAEIRQNLERGTAL